eukprot:1389262-Amorphochlora_amoeboformis.AAC.1
MEGGGERWSPWIHISSWNQNPIRSFADLAGVVYVKETGTVGGVRERKGRRGNEWLRGGGEITAYTHTYLHVYVYIRVAHTP